MRIGLLNIMPEAEKYEDLIFKLLLHQAVDVEIVLIRAKNHAYKSSDKLHLEKHYVSFDQAVEKQQLHGLILTGAPVEFVAFEDITYWNELTEILNYARENIISTMGICWGSIAIGKFLGIDNTIIEDKLFGVFRAKFLKHAHWIAGDGNVEFECPQSRYAGLDETQLINAEKQGKINLLAASTTAGHFIFESSDESFLAHLGHPEYDIHRIMMEYERDKLKGLNLIPENFNVTNPINSWQQYSSALFANWLKRIEQKCNLKTE